MFLKKINYLILKWKCNVCVTVENESHQGNFLSLRCLTLPEAPWTCPLVGCGTWGLLRSHTPWQSTGGPADRGDRREELGMDGDTNMPHCFFLQSKTAKLHKSSEITQHFYSLTVQLYPSVQSEKNSVSQPPLTLLSESFYRSCCTFHDKVT